MDLFRARGWTTVITNNLVGYVLSFSTFTIAALTGFVGVLFEQSASAYSNHVRDDSIDHRDQPASYLFGPIPGRRYWAFG